MVIRRVFLWQKLGLAVDKTPPNQRTVIDREWTRGNRFGAAMAEESSVQLVADQPVQRVTVPRGWVVLALVLTSWGILGGLSYGVWSLATML